MNELINSSILIKNYFEEFNDCIQYVYNIKTPYTVTKVFHKEHHEVLAADLYVDAYKEWR